MEVISPPFRYQMVLLGKRMGPWMSQNLKDEGLQLFITFQLHDIASSPVMHFEGGSAEVFLQFEKLQQLTSGLLTKFSLTKKSLQCGKPGQELSLRFSPIRRRSSRS